MIVNRKKLQENRNHENIASFDLTKINMDLITLKKIELNGKHTNYTEKLYFDKYLYKISE